jgi:hypothetical protein
MIPPFLLVVMAAVSSSLSLSLFLFLSLGFVLSRHQEIREDFIF